MDFQQTARERRSIKAYDSEASIPDAELKAIFEDTILSPSSFNLQHWRFVAVRDPEVKQKLQEAAMGQPQVGACSVAWWCVVN